MSKLAGPPIHPGVLLTRELAELQVLPSQLATAIGVPPNRITQILKGTREVTADTAIRLGHWFGTGPEIWIDLQRDYDLRKAQESLRETLKTLPRRPRSSRVDRAAAALR